MKLFTTLGKALDKVLTSTATVLVQTTKTFAVEVKNQLPKKEVKKDEVSKSL